MKKKSHLEKLMDAVPLETRIRVAIQMYFINKEGGAFFVPADETSNQAQRLKKHNEEIIKRYEPLVAEVLDEVRQWRSDRKINNE